MGKLSGSMVVAGGFTSEWTCRAGFTARRLYHATASVFPQQALMFVSIILPEMLHKRIIYHKQQSLAIFRTPNRALGNRSRSIPDYYRDTTRGCGMMDGRPEQSISINTTIC